VWTPGRSGSAVSSPRTRLADSSGFMKARAQLGEGFKPAVYVSVPPLLGFLRGLGVGEGLEVSGAAAYLVQLDSVIQGERVEGDRLVTRTVVGLRP